MKMLSHADARRVYDRIAWIQDLQAYYEDRVLDWIMERAELADARHVFEFGCGTGRFAVDLLDHHLPPSASYRGVDISPVMLRFTRRRLGPFGDRATVRLTGGEPPSGEPAAAYDRFFSHFVLDTMPLDEVALVLDAAHRMLRPGGRAGLSCMTHAFTRLSRVFVSAWLAVRAVRTGLVGGSRPIDLLPMLPAPRWRILHERRVVRGGVPIQAVVAERI